MSEGKLDGLFVDYVLGELEPEVEALVESYLEVEPVARARCEETRAVLGVVERVEGEVLVPKRTGRVVWGGWAVAAAAAVLVVGGLSFVEWGETGGGGEVAVVAGESGVDEVESAGGFWSISELQKRRASSGKKRRLEWESITRAPRIEKRRL